MAAFVEAPIFEYTFSDVFLGGVLTKLDQYGAFSVSSHLSFSSACDPDSPQVGLGGR